MAVIRTSGKIVSTFSLDGTLINSNQNLLSDLTLIFDLRPDNPEIILEDAIDYSRLGWNIDDVVAVITLVGPQGVIYENDDYNDPDIVPATSRIMSTKVYLPLDPEKDYKEVLHGNYTLKVSWYNSALDDYYAFLNTYDFSFDEPEIENKTVSGPYTGTLKSTDITNYGNNLYQLIRTHTIKYPTQLDPVPDDIVSSNAEIQVSPIYTNKWEIIISSFAEYRNPDTLRIYWEGTKNFYHCVYGGCISSMHDAIEELLTKYYLGLACDSGSEEVWQKRFAILNTSWHLLNDAYWKGDTEGADEHSYIIHEQLEAGGISDCSGNTSSLVTACPPWDGGSGGGGSYTFENGITEVSEVVSLGGSLVKDTTINIAGYSHKLYGVSGSNEGTQEITTTKAYTKLGDGSTEAMVTIEKDKISFDYTDLSDSGNNKGYEVGVNGIVEKADYSSGYVARSLISLEYFQNNLGWGSQVVETDGSLTGQGTAADPLKVANPFPGFSTLLDDYGYVEPTHSFADLTSHPTTISGYGITDAVTNFLQLSDTPSSYSGYSEAFLKVNTAGDGVEFVINSGWVPSTGGTFTGQVTISSSNNSPLILQKAGSGGSPGTPEGGVNYLTYHDGDGDVQGYVGIDSNGNLVFKTEVFGQLVKSLTNFDVTGNITLTGTVDGVDIAAFKTSYDSHTHTFASITSKPTTLSGYGITDAMSNQANTWPTEFSSKTSAASADYVVIEDNADSGKKKYVQVGNLPTSATTFLSLTDTPTSFAGNGGYVVKVNTGETALEFVDISSTYLKTAAGTINALTAKTTPVGNDILLIEDSADSYNQKKILISDLPIGTGGDMLKSVYDTDNDGVVDNSEQLGGQPPSYYLDWTNVTNKPTDITNMSLYDTDDLSEGSRLYYTDARVSANTDVSANTSHRGNTSNPHQVTWAQLGGTQPAPTAHASSHITGGSDIIPIFTDSATGLVPVSDADTTHFLRADGTWAKPADTTYSFTNGITESSQVVKLGGGLFEGTIITLNLYSFLVQDPGNSNSSRAGFYTDSIELHSYSSGSYSGNTDFFSLFRGTSAKMGYQSGTSVSQIHIGSSVMQVTDQVNTKGLVYAADYSTNGIADDRWIPDYGAVKAYVDDIAPTYGTTQQIPYTNNTADDFSYSSNFTFDGLKLKTGYVELFYNASGSTPDPDKGWIYTVYDGSSTYNLFYKEGAGNEYRLNVFNEKSSGLRTDEHLGIGADPSQYNLLYVEGAGATSYLVNFHNTDTTGHLLYLHLSGNYSQLAYALNNGSANVSELRGDGSAGFGTTANSSYRVYVSGSVYATVNMYATNFHLTSDRRLKKDIVNLSNGVNILMDLKPSVFRYKENDNKLNYGFIAQDVEKILPDIVEENDKGYKMLSYNQIIAINTSVVKDHEKRIRILEKENKELKSKIKELSDGRS